VPPIYDDLQLNLGAEDQEEIFERDFQDIERDDKFMNHTGERN
jgi:hypothetical protein